MRLKQGGKLIFLDSRLAPEEDALFMLDRALLSEDDRVWAFGDKGAGKKSFIENFSGVFRHKFMEFGMFNERINKYGGMSQEVRTRWIKQGNRFAFVTSATAKQLIKAGRSVKRRCDIIKMKDKLYKMYLGANH